MIYFGLSSTSNLPNIISTVEVPDSPFSCISILKDNINGDEKAYKIFLALKVTQLILDSR